MYIYIYIYIYLFSHGLSSGEKCLFSVVKKTTNLTSGIIHWDVAFLMSLLHVTFRKADPKKMQKVRDLGNSVQCVAVNDDQRITKFWLCYN